ncbi:DUF6085 family protein [Streptomyces koyangensis]|uniref:DUF6085 family protein n=1 Tax=Streptomyces koyangensis TaxID=188770 RepID=UPI003D0556AC
MTDTTTTDQCFTCGDTTEPGHECAPAQLKDALRHARGRLDLLAHSLRTLLAHLAESAAEEQAVPPMLVKRAHSALTARRTRPYHPDVQGRCPGCGGATLFLANGGYITCSSLHCPTPDAATTLLERLPTREAMTGAPSPCRQAAYEAVCDHIRRLGPGLPSDTAQRNASIWRAVHAALDAAGVPARVNPTDPHATTEGHPVPAGRHPVPPARDTGEDAAPDRGGRTQAPPLGDTAAPSPTSTVPVAPTPVPDHPDPGDDDGNTGVRFAYTATVRRDQVHAAITEAFDLLDVERHAQRRQP